MENKAKHSPGEWVRCLGNFGPYIVEQTPGKDRILAKMHYSMTPDLTEEENTANVRLMTAAPKLLRALEYVKQCCAAHDETFLGEFSNEINEAITAARGEDHA